MNNNTNEPDGNSMIKEQIYAHYFCKPENIDSVYYKQNNNIGPQFMGGMISDVNNKAMRRTEQNICKIYYRLPNLNLKEFFDMGLVRPDLIQDRKDDVAEIYQAIQIILQDIDDIKNIQTKKRILYYFRNLANIVKNSDFSRDISVLIAQVAQRNMLVTLADLQCLITENRKSMSETEMTQLTNDLINQTRIEFCATSKDKNTANVVIGLNNVIADNEQKLIDKSMQAEDLQKEQYKMLQEIQELRSIKSNLTAQNQDLHKQNADLKTRNAKLIRANEGFGASLLLLRNKSDDMRQGFFGKGVDEYKFMLQKIVSDNKEWHK